MDTVLFTILKNLKEKACLFLKEFAIIRNGAGKESHIVVLRLFL